MRFFSMFSCILDPSRPIFVDSWSCGEPFGYVKHRSKCTFAFSDIFVISGEFSSILSRFLTILTSFGVPKSPKISINGVSELRSKIDRSKSSKKGAQGATAILGSHNVGSLGSSGGYGGFNKNNQRTDYLTRPWADENRGNSVIVWIF